jgi:hypothetical protein
MQEAENKKFCKKCLLRDMNQNTYFNSLYEYINRLDEDIKADPSEYERRLSICTQCDNLLDGMCRICGCFVELRAVIATNYCPNIEKKW